MEPREAIEIIMNMRQKYPLDERELEAVMTAVGMLDSAAFTKNRIKGIIKKRKDRLNQNT